MRLLFLLLPISLFAAEEPAGIFESRVLPVLKRDCFGCHGDGQTLSKLDMRSREGLLRGGVRGASIVPGKSAESLLYRAVSGHGPLQMPPGGKVAKDVLDALAQWIDGGAPWSEPKADRAWAFKDEDLWAFKPVRSLDKKQTIDRFIAAKLKQKGISPAPQADRRTLIRRVTIDLTGLPPTPEEMDGFLKDQTAAAYPKLVERLLASPRYGERWGRHWLDVVRYADTSGYSNDFERPNAWRYRDYVIRSFNNDKPYDQFVREQVAGDEMYPESADAMIATGFLRAGPWEHTGMSVEAVTRQMFLDDVTHATAATFLGMTLGCARCHDHKFDPLPTKDYYRMQAVFATTEFARPKLAFQAHENTADVAMGKQNLNVFVTRTKASLDELNAYLKRNEKSADASAEVADGVDPEKFEEFKLHQKHMAIYRESLDRFEAKAFSVTSGPLEGMTDGGPNLRYPKRDEYKAPEVHILPGGNVQSPAEKVEPGLLSVVARYSKLQEPVVPATIAGRRTVLANWIANPENPLTARVMVNRIWQYHFGKGIAADPNNFGKMGHKPTHPELLDWLAARFVERGWSVKAIHREILLSDAYQRSSRHPQLEALRTKDPSNDLLAVFSPRRVEAEVLRDSVLSVAGELSLEAGGPGVFPQINEDVARQARHTMGSLAPVYRPSPLKRMRNRRTVYTFQQRGLINPMIDVFNGPNLDFSCERRESSIVPTQAFSLFNGEFVNDMALAFAARLQKEASTPSAQVDRAFLLAYGRAPAEAERKLTLAHLTRMTEQHRAYPAAPPKDPGPVVHTITSELTGKQHQFRQQEDSVAFEANLRADQVKPETRALADLTLVLLNSNEFVYIY